MQNKIYTFSAKTLPFLAIFLSFLYLIFFHIPSIYLGTGAIVTAWLLAFILKIIFHKPRPLGIKVRALFDVDSVFSFPSEHSAIFASLGVVAYSVNHIFGIILLLVAFLIGVSRVLVGFHFSRDILAGWILGIVVALLFIKFYSI